MCDVSFVESLDESGDNYIKCYLVLKVLILFITILY